MLPSFKVLLFYILFALLTGSLQPGISAKRYHDSWSAMSGTLGKRQRVELEGDCWTHQPMRANAFITEMEQEIAAINRHFLYVLNGTILSLDDDHL